MRRILKGPRVGPTFLPRLALAFSTLLPLAAGPALARHCPRGQILRVSKNVCVAKREAVGRHVYYGPTYRGPTKPSSEPEEQAANLEPDSRAGGADLLADRPAAAVPPKKPKPPSSAVSPSLSPYGELSLESFPKP
ncbi:hypothetical protein [uncultured Rhodoblastus sp.]|uniref:hypothetical protein n=1 Tax=uncultured Rhodoblastus sp. TaxID=543037 RepID=UPI002600F7B3|nr:hypothetical protein [uncultured Rhodoblastus sp.]